jgi:hypothetical protein
MSLSVLLSAEQLRAFISDHKAGIVIYTHSEKIDSNLYLQKIAPLVRATPYIAWTQVPADKVEVDQAEYEHIPVTAGYVGGKYIGAFDGNNISKLYKLLDQINLNLGKPAAFSAEIKVLTQGKKNYSSNPNYPTPGSSYNSEISTYNQSLQQSYGQAPKQSYGQSPKQSYTQDSHHASSSGTGATDTSTKGPKQVRSEGEIKNNVSGRNALVLYKKIGCSHCEDMWPLFVQASQNYPQILFLYCMSQDYYPAGISGFPHTDVYKKGSKVDYFEGSSVLKLKAACSMLSQ